jgi:hypothetical protein
LELIIDDSQVVARLALAASESTQLCLSDVVALKAKLPPRQKASWVAWLKSCHTQLHGNPCSVIGCPAIGEKFDRALQLSFKHVMESALVRAASLSPERKRAVWICFNFREGVVTACEDDALPSVTPQTAPNLKRQAANARAAAAAAPEVGARIAVAEGRVCLQLRVGGRETLDFGAEDCDESVTIDELRAEALARSRASARAGVRARASAEQELDQALAAAEADEVERRESWQLAQQLEAERVAREEAQRRAAAAEEAAQEAAREVAAAAQEAATERAAAERTAAEQQAAARQLAAERLERQKEGSMKALELAREREREWRARAATFEQQLYDERRQPDVRVRSENAQALAARREAEQKAARLEVENAKLAKGHARMSKALEQERTNRKSWQSAAFEAEEQAVAPATYY